MADWRALKLKAAGDVHRQFQIPAVYMTHAGGEPVSVRVRLHQKPEAVSGDDTEYGQAAFRMALVDRIIFEVAEVPSILADAFVIFSDAEAYMTGSTSPARNGFVTVDVSPARPRDLDRLLDTVDRQHPAWATVGL